MFLFCSVLVVEKAVYTTLFTIQGIFSKTRSQHAKNDQLENVQYIKHL